MANGLKTFAEKTPGVILKNFGRSSDIKKRPVSDFVSGSRVNYSESNYPPTSSEVKKSLISKAKGFATTTKPYVFGVARFGAEVGIAGIRAGLEENRLAQERERRRLMGSHNSFVSKHIKKHKRLIKMSRKRYRALLKRARGF